MPRFRLEKLASLLGLLAILMSTLAPTVSQTLAAHNRLGAALATYCSVDQAATAAGPSQGTQNHSLGQHWQACAYCGLLAHVPVLPGASVQFGVMLALARAIAAPVRHEVRAIVAYTAAQPRAPPAFS
jgi:hypothetical protein